MSCIPEKSKLSVLLESESILEGYEEIKGDLSWMQDHNNVEQFVNSYKNIGFQGSQLGRAIEEINRMLNWKPSEKDILDDIPPDSKCTVWLSFTSNLISSGLREYFVYLAKHKLIDVIVTSAGGIEEDFVKCLDKTYLGEFSLKGKMMREKGWNRIGNLIVPNKNYCDFENWLQPFLDNCLERQKTEDFLWTPSKLIHEMGMHIDNESSLYYWCAKNNIPVFCPGITDGSLGDNLFFHTYRNPGLVIDVVSDIRKINDIALKAYQSGVIILGGAQEYDGSDSGAHPDEAVSWGKIDSNSCPVKLVFISVPEATVKKMKPVESEKITTPVATCESGISRLLRIMKMNPRQKDAEWSQSDAIQLIQWVKELLAIFAGGFCGICGLTGYVGFFTGIALVFGLCYAYLKMSFIPDDVLDESEAMKEGLTPSVMTFILVWTVVHTVRTQGK